MARITAAVSEFLNIWACEGNASLHLDTSSGGCTVSFRVHLGHPGALLQPTTPPPTSPFPQPTPATPSRQRHRGTSDKERSRRRTAAYQAAVRPPVPLSPPTPAPPVTAARAAKVSTARNTEIVNVSAMSPEVQIPGKTEVVNDEAVIAATEADDLASTSCFATLPPPVNVNCWNCGSVMTPDHQCGEVKTTSLTVQSDLSSVNCNAAQSELKVTGTSLGSPVRKCDSPDSDIPSKTPPLPRRGLNINTFCVKCEKRHPVWQKCQCQSVSPT